MVTTGKRRSAGTAVHMRTTRVFEEATEGENVDGTQTLVRQN